MQSYTETSPSSVQSIVRDVNDNREKKQKLAALKARPLVILHCR